VKTLLITLTLISSLAALVQTAAAQTLAAVNVRFVMPKCDDRDHDTRTSVWIEKGGAVFARDNNVAPNQHLVDPGNYGPYAIPLTGAVSKSQYIGSTTHIHIDPNGNDTWCTRIDVVAIFSDGSTIPSSSGVVVKISESNRDAVFQN
jgi:hypothetical protein